MESQPQNPEYRINPENSHPCIHLAKDLKLQEKKKYSFSFNNSLHAWSFCMLCCRQLICFKNNLTLQSIGYF